MAKLASMQENSSIQIIKNNKNNHAKELIINVHKSKSLVFVKFAYRIYRIVSYLSYCIVSYRIVS